jgi:hypothetical protein
MEDLDDDEVLMMREDAREELILAQEDEPDSEYCSTCFSAVLTFGREARRRGLMLSNLH